MLITKTSPVGIDAAIQKLQAWLHTELMGKWGMDTAIAAQNKLYQCTCRCYRNKTASGYVAEVFTGGKEYREVYWDDTLNAISFFGISAIETYEIGETTNVHLVFFVNLKKLKPSIAHRADEEVRRDVVLLAEKSMYGFKFQSLELGIENVLREYANSYRDDRMRAVDMEPVHCFRLNFELNYSKDICYT